MIYYLTFNDSPSGIFSSQVVDVVKFLKREHGEEIRLVSFISLRKFFENRKKIRNECSDALILPMIPGVNRWRLNSFLLKTLCYLRRPHAIIARSVLASQLAMYAGVKKFVYDGRGAIAAEWYEYQVVADPKMLSEIKFLEKQVIAAADFRIAVSKSLVKYWREEYQYGGNDDVVIPCTLNNAFEATELTEAKIANTRRKLGLDVDDVVFIYSGSLAGWQSFGLLYNFIKPFLTNNKKNKLLFLSEMDASIQKLKNEFPSQIQQYKIKPAEVPDYLLAGDYGLLIREQSMTNRVASPVKFAEYLAGGLKILISDSLGDYSDFVSEHDCGFKYKDFLIAESVPFSMKRKNRALALQYFTKKSLSAEYKKVLDSIRS